MKKVILIGAGGNAAEVHFYIHYSNKVNPQEQINIVGFLDTTDEFYKHYGFEEPYLGSQDSHEVRSDIEYLLCFGNSAYKKELAKKIEEQGGKFFTFIHPTALISPSSKIGKGVLISHNASVGPKVEIGDFNILNSRCTIGHDTKIGNFNFISPQVSLSGNTTIGDNNMFGVNSATIPSINIGNNNTIGAGSIITKDIEHDKIVVGVPGKIIKDKSKNH